MSQLLSGSAHIWGQGGKSPHVIILIFFVTHKGNTPNISVSAAIPRIRPETLFTPCVVHPHCELWVCFYAHVQHLRRDFVWNCCRENTIHGLILGSLVFFQAPLAEPPNCSAMRDRPTSGCACALLWRISSEELRSCLKLELEACGL